MDSKLIDDQSKRVKLFDSDDEDGNIYEDFKIRPQFHGPHGQQMLEFSSQLPDRFKLDERFLEDFEPKSQEDTQVKIAEKNEEREKNIRILESVLGHEVSSKATDTNKFKKRQIRFDPDDENTSHLVKEPETPPENKKKKKKKVLEVKVDQTVPISTERYIEVCPNLKEILNTATPFSFSQQFNLDEVEDSQNSCAKEASNIEEINILDFKKKDGNERSIQFEKLSSKDIIHKSKGDTFYFFISEGDPRLKEGIKFFKRPKLFDEVREEWQKRRENVLELFRRKKRSSQRSHSTRVKNVQNKFAIRKQNFKK